jgi:hypothetical protein
MSDEGVEMVPGTKPEPTGPEDALGSGLKRGGYEDRQDGAAHFEGGEEQNPRVEEVGDTLGNKGGVDSITKKEQEEEEEAP